MTYHMNFFGHRKKFFLAEKIFLKSLVLELGFGLGLGLGFGLGLGLGLG